jgi:hypothetical protein
MVVQTFVWVDARGSTATGNRYDKEGARASADSAAA